MGETARINPYTILHLFLMRGDFCDGNIKKARNCGGG